MEEKTVTVNKAEYDELLDTNTRVDVLQELVNSGHVLNLDFVLDVLGIFH